MEEKKLTISLYSFGFHVSGIPRDPSGHGGGFVFDCRGLPNPGRDPRFLRLTGEDAAVQRYLDEFPEVGEFIENAAALIEITASNYSARKFERLMVSFGCTGGQHRSVFCALRTAERLRESGYYVHLIHIDKPDFV